MVICVSSVSADCRLSARVSILLLAAGLDARTQASVYILPCEVAIDSPLCISSKKMWYVQVFGQNSKVPVVVLEVMHTKK
jgi:hypothetical protein